MIPEPQPGAQQGLRHEATRHVRVSTWALDVDATARIEASSDNRSNATARIEAPCWPMCWPVAAAAGRLPDLLYARVASADKAGEGREALV